MRQPSRRNSNQSTTQTPRETCGKRGDRLESTSECRGWVPASCGSQLSNGNEWIGDSLGRGFDSRRLPPIAKLDENSTRASVTRECKRSRTSTPRRARLVVRSHHATDEAPDD